MIDFGETYSSLNYQVRDVDGNLANAGTVTATITLPDLTTAAPTVANPSTGLYNFDYLTTQAGRHQVLVSATGGTLGSLVRRWVDAFDVWPADPGFIIEFADAKAFLGEQSSLQDDEIRYFVAVATEVVESKVGPCAVRTYIKQVDAEADNACILLLKRPVVTVTSLVPIYSDGTTYATADLKVDAEAGIVRPATRGGLFYGGPWTATYTAGRPQIPDRYIQAARSMLWHLWTTQRGQTADSITPDLLDVAEFEARGPFGLGFSIPHRVIELLQRDSMPSFA